MQAHVKATGHAVAGFFVPILLWEDLSYGQKEDICMSWIKQVQRPDGGGGSGGVASDPVWLLEYPALHDYLTLGTGADGLVRRTSTLTLFTELGAFKCYLNERDAGASLCASGTTVQDALSALEVMLEAENTPWRFSDRAEKVNGRVRRRGS